jgi:hypothetical protein
MLSVPQCNKLVRIQAAAIFQHLDRAMVLAAAWCHAMISVHLPAVAKNLIVCPTKLISASLTNCTTEA